MQGRAAFASEEATCEASTARSKDEAGSEETSEAQSAA